MSNSMKQCPQYMKMYTGINKHINGSTMIADKQ